MRSTAAILLVALAATGALFAEDRYPDRRPRSPGMYGRYSDPVGQTLRDVQSVWSRSRVDRHETQHFRNVVDSLQRFQYDAARGRFDRGRLDHAIDNLNDLAQADQIHPQGRHLLRQRLYDLRSFREDGRHRW